MTPNRPTRILFVCTGNACRSQMAEALARHLAPHATEFFSAGSHPAGYIHPLAVKTLTALGVPFEGQHSKSWNEFADVELDIVLTLCDSAAAETCPVWPGGPVQAHWGLPDPVSRQGSEPERLAMCRQVALVLRDSIEKLLALDLDTLPSEELRRELDRRAPSLATNSGF